MKRWALIVAFLYAAILVTLSLPAVMLAFGSKLHFTDEAKILAAAPYWAWIAMMVLSQLALLAVPVRVAGRRPVTQRRLWLPVITAGLMMGLLAIGAILSLCAAIFGDDTPDPIGFGALACGALIWVAWSIIFFRASRRAEPVDVVSRQCRLMLQGSILELLVAVPTHIVARSRNYCCADMFTFFGLTMGISVMLLSFGPAVYFLYAERWRRTHPQPSAGGEMSR
jgi:hypothetical protein